MKSSVIIAISLVGLVSSPALAQTPIPVHPFKATDCLQLAKEAWYVNETRSDFEKLLTTMNKKIRKVSILKKNLHCSKKQRAKWRSKIIAI